MTTSIQARYFINFDRLAKREVKFRYSKLLFLRDSVTAVNPKRGKFNRTSILLAPIFNPL